MSILDCSVISPLASSAEFSSTSSSPEKNVNFRTSVSFSSLTEIFEKSGDFGSESENSGQSASGTSDATTAVQKVKNMDVSVQTSAAGEKVQSCSEGSSEMETDDRIAKAVEERVAYFVEKISLSSVSGATSKDIQSFSAPREAGNNSQSEHDTKRSGIVRKISLKDLEHSFVTALNMASCNEKTPEKKAGTLPVPSIQVTEASDREDSSTDEPGETPSKSEVSETKGEAIDVTQMGESDIEPVDNSKAIPSTSTASQYKRDESEDNRKERRPFFYISSSDAPASEPSDSGLRQRSVDAEHVEGANPILIDNRETASSSCLCSKSVHGAVFLTSIIIAIAGFILYNFAQQGKIPDFCRHLGLVTAVLAGTVGAFSCFCYSLLEAFPGIPARYDRMRESRRFRSNIGNKSNLDEESWSSEKERAFRRQNGMSSNRTSADSIANDQSEYLLIRQSDHRELVDKTEKLKKEVAGLLDSVSDVMTKIKQQVDAVGDMECGLMNDESSK